MQTFSIVASFEDAFLQVVSSFSSEKKPILFYTLWSRINMETDSKRGGLFSIYSKLAYFELIVTQIGKTFLLKLKFDKRVGSNKGADRRGWSF